MTNNFNQENANTIKVGFEKKHWYVYNDNLRLGFNNTHYPTPAFQLKSETRYILFYQTKTKFDGEKAVLGLNKTLRRLPSITLDKIVHNLTGFVLKDEHIELKTEVGPIEVVYTDFITALKSLR